MVVVVVRVDTLKNLSCIVCVCVHSSYIILFENSKTWSSLHAIVVKFFWAREKEEKRKGIVVFVGKKKHTRTHRFFFLGEKKMKRRKIVMWELWCKMRRSSSLSISLLDERNEHTRNVRFLFLIVYRHCTRKDVYRLSPSLVTMSKMSFSQKKKSRMWERKKRKTKKTQISFFIFFSGE